MARKKNNYEEIKQYIEGIDGNGCKLLSTEHNNCEDLLLIECSCGIKFEKDWYCFKRGQKQCPECGKQIYKNKRKLTYEEVEKRVNALGYELISKEYINSKENIIIKDKEGYYYSPSINYLLKNNKTNKFNKGNLYTVQNIKLWLILNNKEFILLSDKYIKASKHLKWKCLKEGCGEEFEINWNNIQSKNYNCPFCSGHQVCLSNCLATKNPELISEWHPLLNGELTPYDFVCNAHQDIWWKCEKGHEWHTVISHRTSENGRTGCPYCSHRLPSKEYNLLVCNPELASEWDYNKNKKNPEEYCPNGSQKVYWKCQECGWGWKVSINNRNSNNTGCPKCNNSKANNKIIDFCKLNNLDYFPEYRIKECRDKLSLPFDVCIIYNDILHLIEADGKQHFEPVNFNGISDEKALENFKITQLHDQIKNNYCKDNNILLLRIPYWDFKNIDKILANIFII